MEINEQTTMNAWKKALKFIIDEGIDFTDRETRTCREVLNLSLTIRSPKDVDEPIRVMQQSDKWVYPSTEELASIMLDKKNPGIYQYTYGPRIFKFQNVLDQVNSFIIPLLKDDPNSRRAAVFLYDPLLDSNISNKNIPSLIVIQFKIIRHLLHVTSYIRSNDCYIGFPANVFQIYKLQEYIANQLQVNTGSLTIFSASAHIFDEHFEDIRKFVK